MGKWGKCTSGLSGPKFVFVLDAAIFPNWNLNNTIIFQVQ